MPDELSPDERSDQKKAERRTVLECPECFSHRAEVIESNRKMAAECQDCGHVYPIRVRRIQGVSTHQPPPEKRDSGHPRAFPTDESPGNRAEPRKAKNKVEFRDAIVPATRPTRALLEQELDVALTKAGPVGVRREQRIAAQLAEKHMIALESQWHRDTQWLRDQANTSVESNGYWNSRAQARYARRWRPRFLAFLSVTDSPTISAKAARVDVVTAFHQRSKDREFAEHWAEACRRATDLAEARARQLAVEGVLEPVHYMGVVVDYVRKYDGKLLIELLRAKRPEQFKTPGVKVNIGTKGDVFVLTEEDRHELQDITRERLDRKHAASQVVTPQDQQLTNGDTTLIASELPANGAGNASEQKEL